MHGIHMSSGGRYPVLRSLAILYLIMAGIAGVAGLFGAGWALVSAPWNVGNRIALALLTLAGTFFLIVGTLAIAEIIKLFIDIERNTRMTALRAITAMERPATPNDSSPHTNRLDALEEESAEGALLRGH